MGRMHGGGKGFSTSALPYKRNPPSWLKTSSQDAEENIYKFAKKGSTLSQIGVILCDSHSIARVKSVTKNKVLRILKAHGLAPEVPEDLYHLIKKAVAIRKHLKRNIKKGFRSCRSRTKLSPLFYQTTLVIEDAKVQA